MASPLLRVLSLQPELILHALMDHPIALLKLAATCRAARAIVMGNVQLWRNVCSRNHVYLPSSVKTGGWFVTTDTQLTVGELLALVKNDYLLRYGALSDALFITAEHVVNSPSARLLLTDHYCLRAFSKAISIIALPDATTRCEDSRVDVHFDGKTWRHAATVLSDDTFLLGLERDRGRGMELALLTLSRSSLVASKKVIAVYGIHGTDVGVAVVEQTSPSEVLMCVKWREVPQDGVDSVLEVRLVGVRTATPDVVNTKLCWRSTNSYNAVVVAIHHTDDYFLVIDQDADKPRCKLLTKTGDELCALDFDIEACPVATVLGSDADQTIAIAVSSNNESCVLHYSLKQRTLHKIHLVQPMAQTPTFRGEFAIIANPWDSRESLLSYHVAVDRYVFCNPRDGRIVREVPCTGASSVRGRYLFAADVEATTIYDWIDGTFSRKIMGASEIRLSLTGRTIVCSVDRHRGTVHRFCFC